MSAPHIVVTDAPDAADLAAISNGLDQFNIDVTGIADRRPLAVLIKDPDTLEVLGGVTGRTSLGLLFLDVFFSCLKRYADRASAARFCRWPKQKEDVAAAALLCFIR
jgi:hypothetical protein